MNLSPLQRLVKSINIMALRYTQHDWTPASRHALDVVAQVRSLISRLAPQLEAVKDDRKALMTLARQQAHRLLKHPDFYKLHDELKDEKIWNMLEKHERRFFAVACEMMHKPA